MVTTEANELTMKSKKRSITPEDIVGALKVVKEHADKPPELTHTLVSES